MKYIPFVIISESASRQTAKSQDSSFPTLSNAPRPQLIADETYYTPINCRKACIVTYNKDIADALSHCIANKILQAKTRRHGKQFTFYVLPCRDYVAALLK